MGNKIVSLEENIHQELKHLNLYNEQSFHKFSIELSRNSIGYYAVEVYGYYYESDESLRRRMDKIIEKEERRLKLFESIKLRRQKKEGEKELKKKELYLNLKAMFEGEDLNDAKDRIIVGLRNKLAEEKKKRKKLNNNKTNVSI